LRWHLSDRKSDALRGAAAALGRREFLGQSSRAGAGLLLAFYLPTGSKVNVNEDATPEKPFAPNAWLEVVSDGEIKIWCGKSEMGQGVWTSLPMIVAEELDGDWRSVRVVQADLDPRYGEQLTGGSLSVRTSYANLRKAGAAAREMLIAAAAAEWEVDRATCSTSHGEVVHIDTKRRLPFARLIARATTLTPPADPPLKSPAEFKLIGQPIPRTDTRLKVTGQARFGMDARVPGMLIASVERCPVCGGGVKSYNAEQIKNARGVRSVIEVKPVHLTHQFGEESGAGSRNYTRAGVAVIADSTWAAIEARKMLKVEWDEGPAARESSSTLREECIRLTSLPGTVMRNDGDFAKAFASASKKIEAVYEVPFLAHATMEPMNCTAHVHDGQCELWAPTQVPGAAAESVAKALGIPRDRVTVHVMFLGGGFGRRLIQDYAVEAALISRDAGSPVQVVWSREDDIRHDFYRPAAYHTLRAGLDAGGHITAWFHRAASPSIGTFYSGTGIPPRAAAEMNGPDFPAFAVPNLRTEFARVESGMPVGYWRSVENSGNFFAISSFFDEAASAAGRDAVDFLLATLGPARKIDLGADNGAIDVGRQRRVIELAAEKADWGKALPKGSGRGIAAFSGYGSHVAQVAEVSCDAVRGTLRIQRVVCAVDCGLPINPGGVKAQMEGAINFGLAAALNSAITVKDGRVQQSNFHDYEVLRTSDAPPGIDVHVVPSTEAPGGCGELGVPPIAPAVANAIYAATGKRIRRLPVRSADLQ
jgi:isoquinoline 1-oxidoreductase subunit beta